MPPLLRAVNQVPHCIQVHHHFHRVLGQTTHPHSEQTGFDLGRIVWQLVAATVPVVGQLQPIERAGPRQGNPPMRRIQAIFSQRVALVASRRQQRIQPQLIVSLTSS